MKTPKLPSLVFLSCALLFSLVQQAWAGYDLFLRVDGIPGESLDKQHPNEIVALSFKHSQEMTAATSGGGGGRVTFSPLTIVKYLDVASPTLMLNSARGAHIPTAILTVRSQGPSPLEFYKITLSDVLITSVEVSGEGRSPDGKPLETVTLSFRRIEWRYTPQRPDGTAGSPITHYWDVAANTGG